MALAPCDFRLMLNGMEGNVSKNGWYQMRYEHFQDSSEYKRIFVEYMASHKNSLQTLDHIGWAYTWITYEDQFFYMELNCQNWLRAGISCKQIKWEYFEANRGYLICNASKWVNDLSLTDQFTATHNISDPTHFLGIYYKCNNTIDYISNITQPTEDICSILSSQETNHLSTTILGASVGFVGCLCLLITSLILYRCHGRRKAMKPKYVNQIIMQYDIDSVPEKQHRVELENNPIQNLSLKMPDEFYKMTQRQEIVTKIGNIVDEPFEECTSIMTCNCVKRIIYALKYYQSLDIINTKCDRDKLVIFCHETYKSVLDDYIEILERHNNQNDLEGIFQLLITQYDLKECNIMNCKLAWRYNRNRENDQIEKDHEYTFYRDVIDQIHCYLYHLYDMAFRIKRKQNSSGHMKQIDEDNKQWKDSAFTFIYNTINKKKQQLKQINVFSNSRFNNNKFHINTHKINEATVIDGLCIFMKKRIGMSNNEMKSFKYILFSQEYDSDAIEMDVTCDVINSNLAQVNTEYYKIIKEYIHHKKLSKRTFNVGYRFY
eukprot:525476_1